MGVGVKMGMGTRGHVRKAARIVKTGIAGRRARRIGDYTHIADGASAFPSISKITRTVRV